MRCYRANSFLIKRFAEGWQCHGEGEVLTAHQGLPETIKFNTYGKLRFLTYVRAVFGLRKKARALRAKPGIRKANGWGEDFTNEV